MKSFANRWSWCAGIVCCALLANPQCSWGDTIVDSINPLSSPVAGTWNDASVGWFYTPTQNITISEILTKFSSTDGRAVVDQLFDGDPNQLNVLGQAAFNPTANAFSGGTFTPVNLTAGHLYFVGLQGLVGMGFNVTSDAGAVSLDGNGNRVIGSGGVRRFGNSSSGAYHFSDSTYTSPILEFQGTLTNATTTPLPAAGWGVIALLGILRFMRFRDPCRSL